MRYSAVSSGGRGEDAHHRLASDGDRVEIEGAGAELGAIVCDGQIVVEQAELIGLRQASEVRTALSRLMDSALYGLRAGELKAGPGILERADERGSIAVAVRGDDVGADHGRGPGRRRSQRRCDAQWMQLGAHAPPKVRSTTAAALDNANVSPGLACRPRRVPKVVARPYRYYSASVGSLTTPGAPDWGSARRSRGLAGGKDRWRPL